MERSCELCSKPARMYCESDEARLCWDCDAKVHSANFLVAKHSRSLLCHVCQSPTPWKASGTKLSPTVSVCEGCFDNCNYTRNSVAAGAGSRVRIMRRPHPPSEEGEDDDDGDRDSESSAGSPDDDDEEEEEEEGEYYSDEEGEEEEEDGENQVVPWASCPSPSVYSAPPLTASSSSSEHGYFSFSTRYDALKRSRDSDDEEVCCSSQSNSNSIMAAIDNTTKVASFRASKMARVEEEHPELSRRVKLVGALFSFQESTAAAVSVSGSSPGGHSPNASEIIRRISKLSSDAA